MDAWLPHCDHLGILSPVVEGFEEIRVIDLIDPEVIRRRVHWDKWETLCQTKSKGGMGFKDLALFNDVLLAKTRMETVAP